MACVHMRPHLREVIFPLETCPTRFYVTRHDHAPYTRVVRGITVLDCFLLKLTVLLRDTDGLSRTCAAFDAITPSSRSVQTFSVTAQAWRQLFMFIIITFPFPSPC
jgi:hypothetical protein